MSFLRAFGSGPRSDVIGYDPYRLSSPQVFLLSMLVFLAITAFIGFAMGVAGSPAAIETAEQACAAMEQRLSENRPDLLPGAEDYESIFNARLDPDHAVFSSVKTRA